MLTIYAQSKYHIEMKTWYGFLAFVATFCLGTFVLFVFTAVMIDGYRHDFVVSVHTDESVSVGESARSVHGLEPTFI